MATLEVDKDDASSEVLTLRLPVGTLAATLGTAEQVFAQLQEQIKSIQRRQILQKYADLPVEDLIKADVAAQVELAKAVAVLK